MAKTSQTYSTNTFELSSSHFRRTVQRTAYEVSEHCLVSGKWEGGKTAQSSESKLTEPQTNAV